MKTLSNFLSLVGILLLMTTIMASSCHKDIIIPPTPTPGAKPSISSFTVSSTTMTTATFNFSVSNFTTLKLSIDGVSVDVSGSSYTARELSPGKSYSVVLTASNSEGTVNSSKSFTTNKSSLAITEFKATDSTSTGASFSFKATSNVNIVNQVLVNDSTGESIDVTGKNVYSVEGLGSGTSYHFTFKVKDDTGNEVSQQISVVTKFKNSDWFSIVSVTYGDKFAIIGNAVSSKLTIKVNNSSNTTKTLQHLLATFGENGTAVKMLRYSLNGAAWKKVDVANKNIALINVAFDPGENILECYFALKVNVGVANGSALSFKIFDIKESDGSHFPKSGSFPEAVQVGTVDAVTQPTVITSSWNGEMYLNTVTLSPKENNPNGNYSETGLYQAIGIKATGPAGARFASIRLKNPYTAFTGLEFNNSSWVTFTTGVQYYSNIINYSWQNNYITLTLPNDSYNNNIVKTDGVTNNNYYILCGLRNMSSIWFDTGNYTPGKHGLELVSKYDLVILNSNNQQVDISDVPIKQGENVLQN